MNAQKAMIVALVIAVAMLSMEVPLVDAQSCYSNGKFCVSDTCAGYCTGFGSQCTCITGNAVEAAANDSTAGSN
uniref:CC domain-containing protein n=1 Tax=Globodera pallida TaxID=36090 RepID=A0A183C8W5_GLOPA